MIAHVDLARQISWGVFQRESNRLIGTAFAINIINHLLTSAHVISRLSNDQIYVQNDDGTDFPVSEEAYDATGAIGLLRIAQELPQRPVMEIYFGSTFLGGARRRFKSSHYNRSMS